MLLIYGEHCHHEWQLSLGKERWCQGDGSLGKSTVHIGMTSRDAQNAHKKPDCSSLHLWSHSYICDCTSQHDGSRGQENHPEAHASASLIDSLATEPTRDSTSNKAENENRFPKVALWPPMGTMAGACLPTCAHMHNAHTPRHQLVVHHHMTWGMCGSSRGNGLPREWNETVCGRHLKPHLSPKNLTRVSHDCYYTLI